MKGTNEGDHVGRKGEGQEFCERCPDGIEDRVQDGVVTGFVFMCSYEFHTVIGEGCSVVVGRGRFNDPCMFSSTIHFGNELCG